MTPALPPNTLSNNSIAVSLTQEMVRTLTVNPPGNERPLAERLQQVMHGAGLTTKLYPLSPKRASVVGKLSGNGRRPAFAMVGHIDTVPTGDLSWKFNPFSGDIYNGEVRGRGASDMKGGTAAMIGAAIAIARSKVELQGDLIVACTAGEEVDCVGAIDLLSQEVFQDVSAMLLPEPTKMAVWHAEKGALWLNIVTYGKTAHGSMAHEGHNAIGQMMSLLLKVQKFPFKELLHPLLGSPTVNIGTIAGGTKVNVVPDRCEAVVDLRTLPGEDHNEIVHQIKRLAKQDGPTNVQAVEITVLADRPAVETNPDDPFVGSVIKAVNSVTEQEVDVGTAPYFSDAAVLIPKLNIPMILCGPGRPELAHQPNEYVEVERVIQAEKVYEILIRNLLG